MSSPPAVQRARPAPPRLVLGLVLYNLALLLLSPLLLLWLLYRATVQHKGIGRWRDRLGLIPRPPEGATPRVWLHAVSAGEMAALRPVYEVLRAALPEGYLAVSTVTTTGMTVARAGCPQADALLYLPFDWGDCIGLALARMRPDLVVVTEKELWPNFLGLTRALGADVLVVSGRVSDRMMARAARWPWLVRWLYRLPTCVCVQSARDAERLSELGVAEQNVVVAGNTKADTLVARDPEAEAALARDLGVAPGERWIVAGSTHAGEEEILLRAFAGLRAAQPEVRLLLAPRHPERVAEVCAQVVRQGLPVARRSEGRPSREAVVVLDTMGELRAAYALGRAAFVGGTLVPVGGHNLLEPVAAGRPVLFGPHTESCVDVAELVLEAGVGARVKDAEELASWLGRFLSDAGAQAQVAEVGPALLTAQQGAAQRCANIARALLQERTGG